MVFCNNLKSDLFINLIRNSFCIAGNSSMGLLETSYYEKFALNIGSRQKGRLNPGNVVFVNSNVKSIISGLNRIKKYLLKGKKLKKIFMEMKNQQKK